MPLKKWGDVLVNAPEDLLDIGLVCAHGACNLEVRFHLNPLPYPNANETLQHTASCSATTFLLVERPNAQF
jgi:hypothetical protein